MAPTSSPSSTPPRPSVRTLATTIALLLVTAIALSPASASAQDTPTPPPADPADVESIGAIMLAVYDVISGDAGEARDWDRFRSLFVPRRYPEPPSAGRRAHPHTCVAS